MDLSSGLFPSAQSNTQFLTESLKVTVMLCIFFLAVLILFTIISFQKLPNPPFARLMREVARRDKLISDHINEFKVQIKNTFEYGTANPSTILYLIYIVPAKERKYRRPRVCCTPSTVPSLIRGKTT